jgi:MYXO-CTERM domain-containing protein
MNERSGLVILKHLVLGLALMATLPARSVRAQANGDAGVGQPGATFKLTLTPASQNLSAGGLVMYTVTSASGNNPAQTLFLSAGGLPSGVTASFNPAKILSGQASTLTLSASSSATNGSATFTVTGTAVPSNASASASASVTVSGGASGGGCPNGTIDLGGICVPTGCSFTPGRKWDGTALAFTAVIVLGAARRRRRDRRD